MEIQEQSASRLDLAFDKKYRNGCATIISTYLEQKKIDKIEAELLFSEIKQQTPFLLKEYHYNDIANGRLKIIISLLILYKYYASNALLTLIEKITQLILNDMIAYKTGVVWLNPIDDFNLSEKKLFRGNLGIFLGLKLVNRIVLGSNKFIDTLTKNICFDEELKNIENFKDRKLLLKILFSENEEDVERAIVLCSANNQKESLECLLIWMVLNNKKQDDVCYRKIECLYKKWMINNIEDDFFSCYFRSGGNLFDFSGNVQLSATPGEIMFNFIQVNFPILVDFCSVTVIKNHIDNHGNISQLFNRKNFLKEISTLFSGNKNTYLKQIVKRYKILNNEIAKIFHDTNENDYYQQFSKICNLSKDVLFKLKMQVANNEFIIETSFFPWNNLYNKGIVDTEEFINIIEKRKLEKKNIISISKYQRFNKIISWNIRDLITKQQIDFFNFFLKGSECINNYKRKTLNPLSDESITFLSLSFIRIGLLKFTDSNAFVGGNANDDVS